MVPDIELWKLNEFEVRDKHAYVYVVACAHRELGNLRRQPNSAGGIGCHSNCEVLCVKYE